MTIVATDVNKDSVNVGNWSTSKTLIAEMTDSEKHTTATSSIPILVIPCAITVGIVDKVQTGIGNRIETSAHAVFSYTNPESTIAFCGAITYELAGGDTPYFSYDPSSRKFVFTPKSSALHLGNEMTFYIKATSTNFPLNTTDSPVKVEGLLPCTANSYIANRLSISTEHTYDIGLSGPQTFQFTFDTLPDTCIPNYFKEYEIVVTKDGSVVSSPAWITLNNHQTSPSMTVNSSDVTHKGSYLVTVKSKLFNESTFSPSFVLDLFLTPC
jgi:hypothetical protein